MVKAQQNKTDPLHSMQNHITAKKELSRKQLSN